MIKKKDMRMIEVIDYDPSWPGIFEAERDLLLQTIGYVAVEIHHVGSTAVPGLAAKPIIDILIEVTDLAALDELISDMQAIGYRPKGEFGIPNRRYFQKGGDNRSHQIHAFARGDFNVTRHIAFRDYLRTHHEVAKEYGQLKKDVAKACDNDIDRYCDGKDAYIKRIEAIAVKEMAPDQSLQATC
jgi:GrpB-like predicted nucleotidyltransferase (UPF0157 family)